MKRTALRAKSLKRKRTKPGPWRSEAYLAWIRSLDCCITGSDYNAVAHHLLRGTGEKCMGRKSGDNWAIPLAGDIHGDLHRCGDETGFLERNGIDGPALAKALYEAYPDYKQGLRVVRGPQTAE